MAENKVLKTRIKSLYKTWAEWQAVENTFIPLKGEICIADIPASSNAVTQEPALLIKVGDGVKTFKNLPWLSGLSADVHNWALKETLAWSDLSEDFKNALASYVGAGNEYRINKVGEVYTLQTREYDASTGTWGEWSDVTGSSIDISNKTDRKVIGEKGTALIFNEVDGGGAKFEHSDGTWSFVGVNDGGENGLAGQIYTVKRDANGKYVGTRINLTKNGFFYSKNRDSSAMTADDEIATKGNIDEAIASLGSALHYIGMTELASGETIEQALARIVAAYKETHASYELVEGAVAIVDSAEYIYDGTKWDAFGDEGLYATKAELQAARDALEDLIEAEESARIAADTALDAKIDALDDIARTGNVNDLNQDDGDYLILDCNV